MKHYTSSDFWLLYGQLPTEIRALADKNYELLKANPHHPSLQLKRIEELWSVQVGDHYRAIGIDAPEGSNGFGSVVMLTTISSLPNIYEAMRHYQIKQLHIGNMPTSGSICLAAL